MKNLLKIVTIVIVIYSGLLGGAKASAATNSFTCSSNFYQVISGQLKTLDPLTGTYTNIGSNAGFTYNGIGYNVLDNYIYGIATSGAHNGDLYRIDSGGVATDLGLPVGLPATGFDNGAFDLAGNLYIRSNADNHTIYMIDVGANQPDATTMTVTNLNISGSGGIVAGEDDVFINNKLYILLGSNLSIVDLSNDTVTTTSVTGPGGWLSSGNDFGAGWTDQAGELFFSNNESGSIFQISNFNTASPTASFKVAGTITTNNDGANCPLAQQSPFDAPVATNDSYTTPYNTSLNETTTPVLNNDLGNGLAVTSNTNPMHGSVSFNPNGTFLYSPDHDFSGTDQFSYTVTDSFGRTTNATVTIDVTGPLLPSTPNTGYGTPSYTNPILIGLTSLSSIALIGGVRLLYKAKSAYYNYKHGVGRY
jgi:hypothetical protein